MELAEGVWYATPPDPRNWTKYAVRQHLYLGKRYDLPAEWRLVTDRCFVELRVGQFYLGVMFR